MSPVNSSNSSNPFQINFETLVATAPMLGHRLEDRSHIRQAQDSELLELWQAASSIPLGSARQQADFVVAPLDVMVSRNQGRPEFHILELNGTGIGGVSNMPAVAVSGLVNSLKQVAQGCAMPDSVLLLPVSGKESQQSPRLNKLMHEKLIFAEALAAGLAQAGQQSQIVTMAGLQDGTQHLPTGSATVVLGYMKELMDACQVDALGRVRLHGKSVVGAVNDRFCLNLLSHHSGKIDLNHFQPINGTYLAGGDKGVAYSLLDEFLVFDPQAHFPDRVHHAHAHSRQQLIDVVMAWLAMGRRPVIKPHGTGIGHGIEFFMDARESTATICERIDRSLDLTAEYYGLPGGALPYTICDFIDADVIQAPDHRLDGHKYELRVVVYRDGLSLRACPTIAKVASQRFADDQNCRESLINNITHTSANTNQDGGQFMLPLCNRQMLELLDIQVEEITQLCRTATQYVRFCIDEIPRMERRIQHPSADASLPIPPAILQRMLPSRAV